VLWRSSERSIRDSVRNAMRLATEHGFRSTAFPLIGAGTGGKHIKDSGIGDFLDIQCAFGAQTPLCR